MSNFVANALGKKFDEMIVEALLFVTNKFKIGDKLWNMKNGTLVQFSVCSIKLYVEGSLRKIIYNSDFDEEFCHKSKNKCIDSYIASLKKQKEFTNER